MDIKKRLKALMDERGWTVYRLAKEADVPRSTVRDILSKDAEPSISTVEMLCRGLHISLAQFFDEENSVGLSEEERSLLFRWSCLTRREQGIVDEMIAVLAERHGQE